MHNRSRKKYNEGPGSFLLTKWGIDRLNGLRCKSLKAGGIQQAEADGCSPEQQGSVGSKTNKIITMEQQLLLLYARLKREAERCRIYALRAKKDGLPASSRLFRALAASLDMQAQRFLVQLRGMVGSTAENEKQVFTEELPGFIKEYNSLLAEARHAGSKALETGFMHSTAVQENNLALSSHLGDAGQDKEYYVCDFCGYLAVDEPPENCPVCTAPKRRFNNFEAL